MLNNRKSQVLKQYIFCNLILFVLPVMIFSILFYTNIQNQLVDNILTNQKHVLSQAISEIDRHIEEFEILSTRLSYDEYVTQYQITQGGLSKREAIQRISSYHSLNDFFELLFIYYPDQDLVLSNVGESKLNVFIGYEYTLNEQWEINDFKSFMSSTEKLRFPDQNRTIVDNANHIQYFAIANPFPVYSTAPYGCTMAFIPEKYFTDLLSGVIGEINGASCILDGSGQVLFSSNNGVQLSNEVISESIKENFNGKSKIKIDGKSFAVNSLHYEKKDWTFLSVFPQDQFFYSFLKEYWPILLIIFFLVLLGVALGIYIAFRNYRPIYNLKNVLSGNIAKNQDIDEMNSIHQAVLNLFERNRLLIEQADHNRAYIASNLINYIVSGTEGVDDEKFIKKLNSAGIKLPGPEYAMAVLRFSRMMSSLETEAVIVAIYSKSEGKAYGFNMAFNKTIAVLINLNEEINLDKYISSLSDMIEQIMNCRPIVGVGRPCSSIDLLNHSLVEAVAAIESNQSSEYQIIHFSQLKTWKHRKFWYPTQAQLRLLQAIRHGNRAVVEDAVAELHRILNIVNADEDAMIVRFMISSCTAQMLQLSDELVFQPDPGIIERLVNFANLEDYIESIKFLSELLLDFRNNKETDAKTQLYMDIKEYINNNFNRNDLSLSEIADEFGMIPSTLSKFFRQYEGVNFIEYLTACRINAACELLQNTDLPIKKIMRQIGYTDLASFSRKFKSIIGTSPGKFRTVN